MNILIFINTLSVKAGGPSRSVPLMAKGLAEIGINVTLMTTRSNDMNSHSLIGTKVNLFVLEKNWSNKQVEDFIIENKIDIIHYQGVWSPCYHKIAKIARKKNIAYIVSPRGMLEPWSLSQKKWKKKIAMWLYQKKDLEKAACIYTTAQMEKDHIEDLNLNVPTCIIPNGIEIKDYPCRVSQLNIKKQVLFLSRIHKKKGIEILLRTWRNLYKDYEGWTLVIAGNGENDYIDNLSSLIRKLYLSDSVSIIGPIFGTSKRNIYQESSLFCLPSYSENFGMVIAEAMSCGIPVITTRFCPWEILNATKTGWCIDLTPENLEYAMREAMDMNSDDLYSMGQRASILIDENFNYLNIARKTQKLYNWILNKSEKPDFVYD